MYNAITDYCTKNSIRFLTNEPLSRHTTFHIGGEADVFVLIKNENELSSLIKTLNENSLPYLIIGRGSNLLISDDGLRGVVISLEDMKSITLKEDVITAQSGAALLSLCNFAAQNSLSGIEFAYGIPASVGGALYMNAGAYGGEMKDVVISALCMDKNGNVFSVTKDDMQLSYRSSIFKKEAYIILSVDIKLSRGDKEEILNNMNGYFSRRKEKQPLEYASAGSTFKRPEGFFAGALIEKNNLKGVSVGDAQVSQKHAGFVINKGKATCADVLSLIEKIRQTVYDNDGVMLEREVILIESDFKRK